MKHEHSKKLSGVWLDHQEALIVTTEDHKDHGEYAIREKVKSGHTGNPSRELKNILHTDKHFSNKKIINESADHLSENQLVAKVKHHYQPKMHNS